MFAATRTLVVGLVACVLALVATATLQPAQAATNTISGTVSAASGDTLDGTLQAQLYSCSGVSGPCTSPFNGPVPVSATNHTYSFSGMPTGHYSVCIQTKPSTLQSLTDAGCMTNKARPGDVTGPAYVLTSSSPTVDITLQPRGTMSGVVKSDGSNTPLVGETVAVYRNGTEPQPLGTTTTQAGGAFSFKVMVGTNNRVHFLEYLGPNGAHNAEEWWTDKISKETANDASVTNGGNVTINGSLARVALATAPPVVSGTPSLGSTLSSTSGTWNTSQCGSFTFQYRWYRTREDLGQNYIELVRPQSPSPSYVVQSADVGHELYTQVVGFPTSSTTCDAATADSAKTATVPAPAPPAPGVLAISGAPVTSGKAKVGKTLTASAGSASPAAQVGYQWFRVVTKKVKKHKVTVTQAIGGAVGTTYKLKRKDRGTRVYVQVTYAAPGFVTSVLTSAPRKVH